MTIPAPRMWADRMLAHIRDCRECSPPRLCQLGTQLVRLTTWERHGQR